METLLLDKACSFFTVKLYLMVLMAQIQIHHLNQHSKKQCVKVIKEAHSALTFKLFSI